MWRPELVRRGAEAREAGMEVMELDELLLLLAVVRLLLDFCFDLGLDLDSDSNWHLLESGNFLLRIGDFLRSLLSSILFLLAASVLAAGGAWHLGKETGSTSKGWDRRCTTGRHLI